MEWSQWEVTVCNISAAYATDQLSLLIATDGTLTDGNENDSQKHNRYQLLLNKPRGFSIGLARARVSVFNADTQALTSIAAQAFSASHKPIGHRLDRGHQSRGAMHRIGGGPWGGMGPSP